MYSVEDCMKLWTLGPVASCSNCGHKKNYTVGIVLLFSSTI